MRSRVTASALVLALGVTAAAALPASAATASELFISEYIEGSSNNKAVEIYNGTGADVDLDGYTLSQYSNGGTSTSATFNLTGILADGDVYVIAHSSSDPAILAQADLTSGTGLFNGDDALVLTHDDAVIDSFGQVGVDPGSEWTGGGQDDTLVRKPEICAGDTDATDAFDASVEWDVLPTNTFSELGSHTATCEGGPVEDVAPSIASTNPADGAVGVSASGVLGVTFSEPVVATGAFALECSVTGAVDLAVAGGPAEYTLTPAVTLAEGEDCTLTVTAQAVTDIDADDPPDAMTADATVSFTVSPGQITIGEVQGSTDTSPYAGQTVTVEGVVVGDYEGASPNLRGFYLQSPDGATDGDPATSDGIFVFHGNEDTVSLGDVVTVTGEVAEYQGQTQLGFPSDLAVVDTGATVTPAAVTLPFADATGAERYEGMSVEFGQQLFVTELYQLGRFGQLTVSSGDRLDQPSAVVEPGAAANALQAANDLNRVIVDDALNNQNPDPVVLGGGGDPLTASNTVRGGDSVTGLSGVMTYTWAGNSASGNAWRVRPASPESDAPVFEATNPRPTDAPAEGGDVKVASFNVLNYFLSVEGSGDVCGPVGFEQECRGANTPFYDDLYPEDIEVTRQTDKLVAALVALDADVVGIMEMENTPGVEPLAYLAEQLNAEVGAGTWSYVDTGVVGTDVIRVGMLYDTTAVEQAGAIAVLDSSVDPRFDDNRNRPSVAQTFAEVGTGETFTVVVNHWKSKGSCPSTGPDADQGDGASCWNQTRTLGAQALVDWLDTSPTGVVDDDVMVIGDLNAYAMEDPIDVLHNAGYVELGGGDYSYVFDGQWGSLDYVFASESLAEQVTGSAHFHINADEPSVLDYNVDFKTPEQIESLYAPDMYRTSDHDPVLVGLDLGGDEPEPAMCAVDYTIHGQWPGGFISQIWLTNTSAAPIQGWELAWEFAGDEQITNLWSGAAAQSGAAVTVDSLSWNSTIQPGQSVTFGLVGSTASGAQPVDAFVMNGGACA